MTFPIPFLSDLPLDQIGYLAIFVVLLIDGANIPFTPVELFLGLIGYLVALGDISFVGAFLVTVLGNLAGHTISYLLGFMVGKPFFTHYGKYLLITPRHLEYAEGKAKKMGASAAFFFRFVPGLRTFGSILLGALRMNFADFLVLTSAGIAIWNTVFLALGYFFGLNFAQDASWLVPLVIVIIAGGLCLAILAWYLQSTLKKRTNKQIDKTYD